MKVKVLQTQRFAKVYKKLHKNQLPEVNEGIKSVIADPYIGQQKLGNLSFLRVHKFKVLDKQMLLGYVYEDKKLILTLGDLGFHENLYRDIKRVFD